MHAGIHPPPPQDQAPHPGPGTPESRDPTAQCMLRDTGSKRAVRILLECNLVFAFAFTFAQCEWALTCACYEKVPLAAVTVAYCFRNNVDSLQDIVIETILVRKNSIQGPLFLKLLFVDLKTMSPSIH